MENVTKKIKEFLGTGRATKIPTTSAKPVKPRLQVEAREFPWGLPQK
jgi:hypothetical protein